MDATKEAQARIGELRGEISRLEQNWGKADSDAQNASTVERRRAALLARHRIFIGICSVNQEINRLFIEFLRPVRDVKKDCEKRGHIFNGGCCIKCDKEEKEWKEEQKKKEEQKHKQEQRNGTRGEG